MNGTLSEFLNLLDLRGQTWCFVDIRSSGGFTLPPNDAALFYAVIHGSVRITGMSGAALELRANNVAIILSGEAHALRTCDDSPTRTLDFLRDGREVDIPPTFTIGGSGPLVARVLCAKLTVPWPGGLRRIALPPAVTLGTDRQQNRYASSASALRVETLLMASTGSGAAVLLTRLATLMLTLVLRNHPQCLLLMRSSAWNDPIAHAQHLIDSDPTADWSVAHLARKVGMGRSSFAARFAQEIGRTPMEVITERRMQYAACLVQQGEMKIAEIGARAGYRSEAAFSRRFAHHFGLSPSSMRRNARMCRKPGTSPSPQDELVAGMAHLA